MGVVLVTGATGFLGAAVVEQLRRAGHEVRALVRGTSDTSALDVAGVGTVVGSLDSGEGLEGVMEGVQLVAHLAGGGVARTVAGIYRSNRDTTVNLLAGLPAALERFVFVSSLSAHGPSPDGQPRNPDEPASPVTHYGRAKAQAEDAVRGVSDRIPVTILRPPAIYGPADWRMLPMFRMAASGFLALPSSARKSSLVHVDDCAGAVVAALSAGHPPGRAYFVDDQRTRDWSERATLMGAAVGRRVRIVRVPGAALFAAGALSEVWGKLTRRPVLLHRDKVRDITRRYWVCDSRPLTEATGWVPAVDFADGAKQTVAWYREQRWMA